MMNMSLLGRKVEDLNSECILEAELKHPFRIIELTLINIQVIIKLIVDRTSQPRRKDNSMIILRLLLLNKSNCKDKILNLNKKK